MLIFVIQLYVLIVLICIGIKKKKKKKKKSSSNKTCTLYQKRTLYISVSRVVFVSEFLALFMFVRKCYNNVLKVDVLNF